MTKENFRRVAIGILAYSRPYSLVLTLESIVSLNASNTNTFLLQNGMDDGEFNKVVKAYPWVVAIRSPENLGAAGGRNHLINLLLKEDFEYLFLVDGDIILAPDSLERLLRVYPELVNPGLVSCLVRAHEQPERIFLSGIGFNWFSLEYLVHTDLPSVPVIERQAVGTGAVLISSCVLRRAPRLDDRFFLDLEDNDWCMQMSILGYKHYVVRDAVAYHPDIGGKHLQPLLVYYRARNHMLLLKKLGIPLTQPKVLRLVLGEVKHRLRRIFALTPLSITALVFAILAYFHVIIRRWGKAPGWMYKSPERFLEYRFNRLIFQPRIVCAVKAVLNGSAVRGSRKT